MKSIWRLANAFGVVAGVASVVMLARQAFAIGFVVPLQAMLDWYIAAVDFVFAPLEPALSWLVRWLAQHVDGVQLAADWRHYVVLGMVLFGAALRTRGTYELVTVGFTMLLICLQAAVFGWAGNVALFALVIVLALVLTLAIHVAWSRLTRDKSWTVADAVGYLRSIGVVFGGALLFVLLNAGLQMG